MTFFQVLDKSIHVQLSCAVHLDVTPIVFQYFLEALAVRQRCFLAHLDGDLCEGGSEPTV